MVPRDKIELPTRESLGLTLVITIHSYFNSTWPKLTLCRSLGTFLQAIFSRRCTLQRVWNVHSRSSSRIIFPSLGHQSPSVPVAPNPICAIILDQFPYCGPFSFHIAATLKYVRH